MSEMTIDQALELALRHHQAGRLAEAESIYRQILSHQPRHAPALHLLGVLAGQTGRTDEAISLIHQSINLAPTEAAAFNNLGNLLLAKGRLDEAGACFQKAIQLQPRMMEPYGNLGMIFETRRRYADAIACYQEALKIHPNHAGVHYNLGVSLGEMGQVQESAASYRRALQLDPHHALALNNLGNALRAMGRPDEAIEAYQAALKLRPDFAEAHNNLGVVHDGKGELDVALACYRRALEIKPDFADAHSNFVYSLHFHPDSTPQTLLREHLAWNQQHAAPLKRFIAPHNNDRSPERCLRIGYVSPDLRNHVVGRFLLPLLERHDKAAVEVFCYTDVRAEDALTQRLRAHADHWRPALGMTDEQLAAQIRRDGIDILVDLTMHMKGGRLPAFARKPAPVQVSYLAYCSTTGLEAMDYRITDGHFDPEGEGEEGGLSSYSEKSIRLESYWCYMACDEAAPVNELPALRDGRMTFGCLNSFNKVSRQAFETWTRILQEVPQSRLLVHAKEGSHRRRLHQMLADAGVEPDRLEFAGPMALTDYFQRYHAIDIALDPFPYAGGTTTCDALFMGVPVITLAGTMAVGRGGVSILSTMGMPECIAPDVDHYVRLAAELAADLSRLKALRATLRQRMEGSPLMDAPRFARDMEAAFRTMWRRWCGPALASASSAP